MHHRAGRTWIFVTLFLLLAMAGVAVWLFSGIRGAQPGDDLEELMARAKAAGFPMTRDEAYPPATGKPEDNGAAELLAGQDLLKAKFGPNTEGAAGLMKWRRSGISGQERTDILKAAAPGLARVCAALAKPYIHFEKDFDRSTFMEFPETGHYKPSYDLLLLSAEVAADQGDSAKALQELGLTVKLNAAITQAPLMIHALVSAATRFHLDGTLRYVAAKFANNPKVMEDLAKLVASLPQSIDVHRVVAEEFYTTLGLARNLNTMGGPKAMERLRHLDDKVSDLFPKGSALVRDGLPRDDYSRGQLREAVSTYLQVDAVLQDPKLDVTARLDKLKRICADLDRSTASMDQLAQMVFSIGKQVFPALERMRGNAAVEEAYMKVMLFRAKQGRFPGTLKEANAVVPDPFFDGPLNYFVQGTGFTVMTPGLETEITDPSTGNPKKMTVKIQMVFPPKAGD